MYRFLNERSQSRANQSVDEDYAQFQGQVVVVDLATIDGQTEDFPGRAWLDNRVKDRQPVGWDVEWVPDRVKESDNPIALMQFADENFALLLRTHRTKNWLPGSVLRALLSPTCVKVGIGWDGPDRQKMQRSFDLEPMNVVDLAVLAKKKGLQDQGLRALAEHFGMRMRKDSRAARSDWAAEELTQEQTSYAAEDAHFAFLVHERLQELPDLEPEKEEGYDIVNQGALAVQPGWAEQGIVRKHDGLHCELCKVGPMGVATSVVSHMDGKKHKQRMQAKLGFGPNGEPPELPERYVTQGIVAGDGLNGIRIGEYKCQHCNAGPFNALQTVDAHINGKQHQKAVGGGIQPTEQKDLCAAGMWNLPDYVTVVDNSLVCGLCSSKASSLVQIYSHLGGNAHARKCRASGKEEVIYVKDRCRVEVLSTGLPVVRTGFQMPEGCQASVPAPAKAEPAKAEPAKAKPAGEQPLPAGWQQHTDAASGLVYYYHEATRRSQWERPDAPAATEPEPPPDPSAALPPGWQAVWSEESGKYYYADLETQAVQWEQPPVYTHQDWKRNVDPHGRAFWAAANTGLSFYEDDSNWRRLLDEKKRIYWSNETMQLRFFEAPP